MEPEALAFGRSGELYLIDSQRDQVLASQSPYHSFTVFAGSGTRGFSGDGGPATMAKLSLSFDSGIAVASTGSVYLVDSANKRIREVLQNGEIETVARGGTISLEAQFDPAGVTIGPNGDLYVAARQGAYELTPSGILDWIVGKQVPIASWAGWEANPSGENDFENAVQVAFDREGDLFVAGGGAQGLYERTTAGALRFVGVDRGPGGFLAAIAPGPGGSVLGAAYELSSYNPNGRSRAIANTLSTVLGPVPHPNAGGIKDWMFVVGTGVALSPDGDIFVDAATGNTISVVPAIARVAPGGHTSLVWRGLCRLTRSRCNADLRPSVPDRRLDALN
jgi:hypothetical protein